MPSFRRGGDAAEAALKTGGNFSREVFFGIEDGETAVIRWLTDEPEWISVDMYGFLPTKPAPADWTGNWPKSMPVVSRQSRNADKELVFPWLADNDFIRDHMIDPKTNKPYSPSSRTWAYCCVREEVRNDQGQLLGYRDKMRDNTYEKDGETVTEKVKDIQILNLGFKTFFSIFNGYAKHFKTLLDRDYIVTRKGSGIKDTSYTAIPLDPIRLDDATCQQLGIPAGSNYDLRIPAIAALYHPEATLEELIMNRVSDEYMARFFDTRVTAPSNAKAGASSAAGAAQAAPAAQQVRPSTDVDPAKMAALTDRVLGFAAPAAPTAEPAVGGAPQAFIS
jgi:hypothetical protein